MNEKQQDQQPPADEQPIPPLKHVRLWYWLSYLIALALLGIIALIWYLVYNAPYGTLPGETIMTTRQEIRNYQLATVKPFAGYEPPAYIPTGVVIQSLEFKGPYTVQIAGYVWQRYSKSESDLVQGVIFPEADTTTFTKVYSAEQGDETLIGWNFKTTVREQFDYADYPLDRQEIRLRMWALDFSHNVFLEPDVEDYKNLTPETLPGLDPGVILENWKIDRSFFSYRLNKYNANFGIQGYVADVPQPELYYNISVKRYILSPLVARGIAPVVILIQLFVIVTVIGSDSKRLEQFGVRPGAVIFTCAAFFFAVLIAENSLRDELKSYGVVYLESLHLLTYIVILVVAANSVALVAFPKSRLFIRDNIWVELLYWPLIMLILLSITVETLQLVYV